MCLNTELDSGRELLSCTLVAFEFHGTFPPVFFGQSFDLPGSESVFGVCQVPPCVRLHLVANKWILVKRFMGRLTSLTMR